MTGTTTATHPPFTFQINLIESDETALAQAETVTTTTGNIRVPERRNLHTKTRPDVAKFLSSTDAAGQSKSDLIVTPGEGITNDALWMKGEGTLSEKDPNAEAEDRMKKLMSATLCGYLVRTNKLLTVTPLHTRYLGAVGDLVVGRVMAVQSKRWKVDVNSKQDASLALSSVHLPGGVQRRRLEEDSLQMRDMFSVGDMLVAEVQTVGADGQINLHSRSSKYGKLRDGCLFVVPSQLVVRSKSQFLRLPWDVDVVLGLNGNIWVQYGAKQAVSEDHVARAITGDDWLQEVSLDPRELYSNANHPITPEQREKISRTYNCVQALAQTSTPISETVLRCLYEASMMPRRAGEEMDATEVDASKGFFVYRASDVVRRKVMLKLVAEAKSRVAREARAAI